MRTAMFLPPIVQLLIFGFAVNLDVEHITIAWMDQDHTPASRELLAGVSGLRAASQIVATPASEAEVQELLDEGAVQAVMRVLPGFARDLDRRRETAVQVLIDGTNSNTASLVSSYAGEIIAHLRRRCRLKQEQARAILRSRPAASTYAHPAWKPAPRLVQPGLAQPQLLRSRSDGQHPHDRHRHADRAGHRARERDRHHGAVDGTPIRPIELMLGKTLPFALVGLIDIVLVTVVALLLFRVPFRGSFLLLLFCAALFLMTAWGWGCSSPRFRGPSSRPSCRRSSSPHRLSC